MKLVPQTLALCMYLDPGQLW